MAKPRRVADNTAMTNPARLQPLSASPELLNDGLNDELADVRMDKVERLRAAIAEGSYVVSTAALADKLIEHMRDLDLTRPRKRQR